MFLGVDKLLHLVKTKNLVTDLCERELTNPEGCGFDLRLGQVWRIKGKGYLGVEDRKTCETELVAEWNNVHLGSVPDARPPAGGATPEVKLARMNPGAKTPQRWPRPVP